MLLPLFIITPCSIFNSVMYFKFIAESRYLTAVSQHLYNLLLRFTITSLIFYDLKATDKSWLAMSSLVIGILSEIAIAVISFIQLFRGQVMGIPIFQYFSKPVKQLRKDAKEFLKPKMVSVQQFFKTLVFCLFLLSDQAVLLLHMELTNFRSPQKQLFFDDIFFQTVFMQTCGFINVCAMIYGVMLLQIMKQGEKAKFHSKMFRLFVLLVVLTAVLTAIAIALFLFGDVLRIIFPHNFKSYDSKAALLRLMQWVPAAALESLLAVYLLVNNMFEVLFLIVAAKVSTFLIISFTGD